MDERNDPARRRERGLEQVRRLTLGAGAAAVAATAAFAGLAAAHDHRSQGDDGTTATAPAVSQETVDPAPSEDPAPVVTPPASSSEPPVAVSGGS